MALPYRITVTCTIFRNVLLLRTTGTINAKLQKSLGEEHKSC